MFREFLPVRSSRVTLFFSYSLNLDDGTDSPETTVSNYLTPRNNQETDEVISKPAKANDLAIVFLIIPTQRWSREWPKHVVGHCVL